LQNVFGPRASSAQNVHLRPVRLRPARRTQRATADNLRRGERKLALRVGSPTEARTPF
jgi:hypothetical protein